MVGEAFTKLRYDRRVSPRRDATIALAAFALVDDNPDVFQPVAVPPEAYGRARAILQQYGDHSFSYVDALVFDAVERDRSIRRVLTVDGADFRSFRFSRPVEIVTP